MTRRWISLLSAAVLAVLVTVPAASAPAAATVTEPVGPTTVTRGLTWVGGGVMNPYRGFPVDVSCPTTTWCMSVDLYGESLVLSGGTWANRQRAAGSTVRGDLQFRAVSCPTTSWCLATMFNRRLAVWSGGTWRVLDVDEDYEDVSCWRTNGCGLTVSWGSGVAPPDFARWTDGSVTAKVAVPNRDRGMDVSCPTSTCFFLTAAGSTRTLYVHKITGSTTFTTTRAGASPSWGWESLDCASTTSCMVTFGSGFRTMSGSTWSSTKSIDVGSGETVTPMAVSCSSSSACTAVGYYWNGVGAARWNGRTWSVGRLGVGANTGRSVDCPSSSSCTVVDERGRFNRWNGSTWTARATFDTARGGLRSLECPSSSRCIATDGSGNSLEFASGAWSWHLLSENASDLDCTSSSFCVAVDWLEDSRRVRTSAGWQPANTNSHVYGRVACATTTRCFAVASNVVHPFSPARDGDLQALPVDLGNDYLAGDCGSSSFCLFVGANGRSVSWNGSRWVSRGTVPGGAGAPPDVDCLSATFCVVAAGGSVSVLTPSGWRRIAAEQPVSVSCRATTSCFALGSDGSLRRWNGQTWSDTGHRFGDGSFGDGQVRCVATGLCMVLAEGRAWWTG